MLPDQRRSRPATTPPSAIGRSRSRALPLLAAGAALFALSGCAAGQTNETSQETAAVQAADFTVGDLYVQDAYITPVGQAAPPPAGLSFAPTTGTIETAPPGTNAVPTTSIAGYLVASVIDNSNSSPDQLIGVSISGATTALVPSTTQPVIPPNGTFRLNDPAASSRGPFVTISAPTTPLQFGTYMKVTFDFAKAGESKTISVPVVQSPAGSPPATPPGMPASSAPATTSAAVPTGTESTASAAS